MLLVQFSTVVLIAINNSISNMVVKLPVFERDHYLFEYRQRGYRRIEARSITNYEDNNTHKRV